MKSYPETRFAKRWSFASCARPPSSEATITVFWPVREKLNQTDSICKEYGSTSRYCHSVLTTGSSLATTLEIRKSGSILAGDTSWSLKKSKTACLSQSKSMGLPISRTTLVLYCLTTVMFTKSSWLAVSANVLVSNVTTNLELADMISPGCPVTSKEYRVKHRNLMNIILRFLLIQR